MTARARTRPERAGGAPRRPGRRGRLPIALTGSPGVGKSVVARRLASRWRVVELRDLALREGAGRRVPGGITVDLLALRRRLERNHDLERFDVVAGHLSHLLPVRAAIVLRCHPVSLARRLARARRGSPPDRAANVASEAIDLVLLEALRQGVPVYEIDTTARTVPAVTREVDRILRGEGRPRQGIVDWLADPSVTAHLLHRSG